MCSPDHSAASRFRASGATLDNDTDRLLFRLNRNRFLALITDLPHLPATDSALAGVRSAGEVLPELFRLYFDQQRQRVHEYLACRVSPAGNFARS